MQLIYIPKDRTATTHQPHKRQHQTTIENRWPKISTAEICRWSIRLDHPLRSFAMSCSIIVSVTAPSGLTDGKLRYSPRNNDTSRFTTVTYVCLHTTRLAHVPLYIQCIKIYYIVITIFQYIIHIHVCIGTCSFKCGHACTAVR